MKFKKRKEKLKKDTFTEETRLASENGGCPVKGYQPCR